MSDVASCKRCTLHRDKRAFEWAPRVRGSLHIRRLKVQRTKGEVSARLTLCIWAFSNGDNFFPFIIHKAVTVLITSLIEEFIDEYKYGETWDILYIKYSWWWFEDGSLYFRCLPRRSDLGNLFSRRLLLSENLFLWNFYLNWLIELRDSLRKCYKSTLWHIPRLSA